MVALAERQKADRWPTEHENSIMHVVEPLNEYFGPYPNDAPLTEFAVLDPNADRRHPQARLIGGIWQKSGATHPQLKRIERLIGIVYRKAGHITTFGMLRDACDNDKIATLSGVGVVGQDFLAGVVRAKSSGGS